MERQNRPRARGRRDGRARTPKGGRLRGTGGSAGVRLVSRGTPAGFACQCAEPPWHARGFIRCAQGGTLAVSWAGLSIPPGSATSNGEVGNFGTQCRFRCHFSQYRDLIIYHRQSVPARLQACPSSKACPPSTMRTGEWMAPLAH